MSVIRLDIAGFRNLIAAKLEPIAHGVNFIYGNNGSGKTSLLEAIYYLSLGRSFRSSILSRIICHEGDKFSLFAHILMQSEQITPIGIERDLQGEVKIRIAGQDVRTTAELANLTPVQLLNSQCFNLLDAPSFRRKYLDWGAFYLSNDFLRRWRQCERALKQRNAALRGMISKLELAVWTQELVDNTVELDRIRREYVQNLLPLLRSVVGELLSVDNLDLSYMPGWNEERNYAEILADSEARDRQLGHTQFGPHRADFKMNVNGVPLKDILSRGQQKLFVCAMLSSQGTLLHNYTNKRPIYLVDDLPAELDATSRFHLMSLLSKQKAQVFVTAVERETLEKFLTQTPTKMFHVEHGKITTPG